MQILKNISLKPYNTFGINAKAAQWIEINSVLELKDALYYIKQNKLPYYVLGHGSNTLFSGDFDGVILYMNIMGKEILRKTETLVLIKAYAGEVWHDFVMWSLENNYNGMENMALIPGRVGSAPIQNIGAYGMEVKDVIECVEVLDVESMQIKKIVNTDCQFGYRESIFKKNNAKYIITAVSFILKRNQKDQQFLTSYGAIQTVLKENKIENPTALDVANAIISIRQSKLPDPKIMGNSGSFFKNPLVSKDLFSKIQSDYPEVPSFPATDTEVKLPAGWLIEQCGFKGRRFGNVGVHEHQALVLVNYGQAIGSEVLALAQQIQDTVREKFAISLEMEVNVV